MNLPPVVNENLHDTSIALAEEIMNNSSKKMRKQLLRDKSLVGKNDDYKVYKQLSTEIAFNYNQARDLVKDSQLMLAEVPDPDITSLTESLDNDLNKIKDQVQYITTVFNGTKRNGTTNIQQRIKVIQVSEKAQELSNNLMYSILPTATELGSKMLDHIKKIEEDLKNE